MNCEHVDIDGVRVIVCGSRRRKRARCAVKGCAAWSTVLCDAPISPTDTGDADTCDKELCPRHALHVGADRDHCPEHARRDLERRWRELPEETRAAAWERALRLRGNLAAVHKLIGELEASPSP